MAKLNYSKPMFSVCPIPLEAGGSFGGCAQKAVSGQYVCPVKDEYDEYLFASTNDGCETLTQAGEATVCYMVPDSNMNVYGS